MPKSQRDSLSENKKSGQQDPNRYEKIIRWVFEKYYNKKTGEAEYERIDYEKAAKALKVDLPKNLGDINYSFNYRMDQPTWLKDNVRKGHHWVIESRGKSKYVLRQRKTIELTVNPDHLVVKIPDSTPTIIRNHTLSDEQALLAVMRYNRMIDLMTGTVAYSLQSHLRTTVNKRQIETDEIYVGVSKSGTQYVYPVQAKGKEDRIGLPQIAADIDMCGDKFPNLVCRPIIAYFERESKIVNMYELATQDGEIRIVEVKRFQLVESESIDNETLSLYRSSQ